MDKNEKVWLLKELMLSPAWEVMKEEMLGLIEDRRKLLETVSPENKKVQYDWYDLLRTDIDNWRTLMNLPQIVVDRIESETVEVDKSSEL